MNSTPLDDSLTSIQWLCQLESNKLMQKDGAESGKNSELQVKAEIQPNQILHENPYPKPHYSYATLIVFAINSSREKRMTLQEIYSWIEENYPFYKFAKKGWKVGSFNSLLHGNFLALLAELDLARMRYRKASPSYTPFTRYRYETPPVSNYHGTNLFTRLRFHITVSNRYG